MNLTAPQKRFVKRLRDNSKTYKVVRNPAGHETVMKVAEFEKLKSLAMELQIPVTKLLRGDLD